MGIYIYVIGNACLCGGRYSLPRLEIDKDTGISHVGILFWIPGLGDFVGGTI